MSNLIAALDQVCSHTAQIKKLALNSKERSRDTILSHLQDYLDDLDTQQDLLKTVEEQKPRGLKIHMRDLRSLAESLHSGISDSEINRTEFREIVMDMINPIMINVAEIAEKVRAKKEKQARVDNAVNSVVDEGWRNISSKDKDQQLQAAGDALLNGEKTREQIETELEIERTQQTSQKLVSYKRYEKRLVQPRSDELKSLKSGMVLPVECSIFVNFDNSQLRQVDTLRSYGFKVTSISSTPGADIPDVALVLENQILLQFSRSAAKESLINSHQEKRKSFNKSKDATVLRGLKKDLRKLEKQIVEAEKLTESKDPSTKKLAEKHLAQLEAKQDQLDTDIKHKEALLKQKRHKLTVSHRETFTRSEMKNSEGRAKVYVKSSSLELFVVDKLNAFREKGRDYSMISSEFVPHPTCSDIYLAWLVPTEAAKVFRTIYSDQDLVDSWGFPWKVNVR